MWYHNDPIVPYSTVNSFAYVIIFVSTERNRSGIEALAPQYSLSAKLYSPLLHFCKSHPSLYKIHRRALCTKFFVCYVVLLGVWANSETTDEDGMWYLLGLK